MGKLWGVYHENLGENWPWYNGTKICHCITTIKTTRTTRTPVFWDTLCRPMITNTSDSHQIPSQNKTRSKSQILKKFEILQAALHASHLVKLLDKMCKYEKDPTRIVGATERTRDAGPTDGWSEANIPPQQLCCVWGINMFNENHEELNYHYCQSSNISHTLAGNKLADHSDVVGASPVGAAPITSSLSTGFKSDCPMTTVRQEEKYYSFGIWCSLY